MLLRQARFRFYGSSNVYSRVASDLLSGWVTRGDDIASLEGEVCAELGVAHALCVPQGRVGIYYALREIIKAGQNVILSPYTIHDVVNMVVCAGGRPIFADIDSHTCNISPKAIARLIDVNTGAVLVTHLHGLACDIEEIAALCQAKGVPLVEDAAQAFGARVGLKAVGTFGAAGIFSFGRMKNVNSLFGGIVVTADKPMHARMAERMKDLPYQEHGRLGKRALHCLALDLLVSPPLFPTLTSWMLRAACLLDIKAVNTLVQTEGNPIRRNSIPEHYLRRMTPMQARLICSSLPYVSAHTGARIASAAAYHDLLSDIPEVLLPPLRLDGSHIYYTFPIQVANRRALVRHMARCGRDISIQHICNTADLPMFAEFTSDCPNARQVAQSVVLLPTYPGYRLDQIKENVAAIRGYFDAASRFGRNTIS